MITILISVENQNDLAVTKKLTEMSTSVDGWAPDYMGHGHISGIDEIYSLLKDEYPDLWEVIKAAIKPVYQRTREGMVANWKTYSEWSMVEFLHALANDNPYATIGLLYPEALLSGQWLTAIIRLIAIMSERGKKIAVATHRHDVVDLVKEITGGANVKVIDMDKKSI